MLSYLHAMYDGSTEARRALEEGTEHGTIRIGKSDLDSLPAYNPGPGTGAHYVAINLSRLPDIYIFNNTGQLTQVRPETVLIHEIFHYVYGLGDPDLPDISANVSSTFDYRGPAVEFESIVNAEMGWADKIRPSYLKILTDDERFHLLSVGVSYTNGEKIDVVRLGGPESEFFDMSPRPDNSRDLLIGLGSLDVLSGGGGRDFLYGGDGNDLLTGGLGSDDIYGQGGSDTAIFEDDLHAYSLFRDVSGAYFVKQLASGDVDRLVGVEFLKFGSAASVEISTLDWSEGSPPPPTSPPLHPFPSIPSIGSFTYTGTTAADVNLGTSGSDVMRGLDGADALGGGNGDDKILGNGGPDALNGGANNDLLIDDDQSNLSYDNLAGDAGDDSLVFYGAPSGHTDVGDGGSGDDLAYIDLSNRTRDWQLTDDDGDIHIQLQSGTSEGDLRLTNIETIAVLFGSGDDFAHVQHERAYLKGGGGNDNLSSEDDDDFLDGGSGDDHLDSGRGVDWIDGGTGNDLADVDLRLESRALTYVADYSASSSGFTFENGTHIQNVERINLETGSGDDRIWLGDDADVVDTNGGDDYVYTELWGKIQSTAARDMIVWSSISAIPTSD